MKIFRRNFIKIFFCHYLWHIKCTNFYTKKLQNCMGKKKKIFSVAFTGFNKNKLSKIKNYSFIVNSKKYNIIENVSSVWSLMTINRPTKKLIF